MKPRAVLFDFDGTLIDSYDAITASVNYVRSRHSLPPLPQTQVRHMVGHGILQLMAAVVPNGDPQADVAIYLDHHPSVMYDHTWLLPGVEQALIDLRQAGLKLAICSNKLVGVTRALIDALGIARYLDAAYGPEDAGKPKPDPAMVLLALKRLGVAKTEAIYVGDMPVDIETARNAGIAVWVVPTGSSDRATLEAAKPDRVFDGMAEVATAILQAGE